MGACTGIQNQREKPNQELMPYRVCFTAYILKPNPSNLFDFEGGEQKRIEVEVDFSCSIAAVDKELVALTKHEQYRNQRTLLNLECQTDQIKFCGISQKLEHHVWAIVRNNDSFSYFDSIKHWDMSNNDIVKMGRVRLQLMEYKFVAQGQKVQDEQQIVVLNDQIVDLVSCDDDVEGLQCRICFSSKATKLNPLISPCKCTGSVKFTHLECLQTWMGVKIKIKKSHHSTMYQWKKLECDICKKSFKIIYTYQGHTYTILNIPRPSSSYMMLNITDDNKLSGGMIYILLLGSKQEITIGRVPECEIKLKDISVSRQHAIIKLIPDRDHIPERPKYIMRLFDNNSKYGTLVSATSDKLRTFYIPKCIKQSRQIFQIGCVLIHMTIKQKTKNYKGSAYKHPSCLKNLILIKNQSSPQKQDEFDQFQINNELNMSDIVINQPQTQTEVQAYNEVRIDDLQ